MNTTSQPHVHAITVDVYNFTAYNYTHLDTFVYMYDWHEAQLQNVSHEL